MKSSIATNLPTCTSSTVVSSSCPFYTREATQAYLSTVSRNGVARLAVAKTYMCSVPTSSSISCHSHLHLTFALHLDCRHDEARTKPKHAPVLKYLTLPHFPHDPQNVTASHPQHAVRKKHFKTQRRMTTVLRLRGGIKACFSHVAAHQFQPAGGLI